FFSSRRRHTRLVSDWSSDVCSSDLERLDGDTLAQPQRARALGAVQLVARDRDRVDAERRDVDRDLAERLCGVDVDVRIRRARAGSEEGREGKGGNAGRGPGTAKKTR